MNLTPTLNYRLIYIYRIMKTKNIKHSLSRLRKKKKNHHREISSSPNNTQLPNHQHIRKNCATCASHLTLKNPLYRTHARALSHQPRFCFHPSILRPSVRTLSLPPPPPLCPRSDLRARARRCSAMLHSRPPHCVPDSAAANVVARAYTTTTTRIFTFCTYSRVNHIINQTNGDE